MGKLLITEEDRRHILKLYNIIKEDIDPKTGGSVKILNNYKPGFYTLQSTDTKDNKPIIDKLNSELSKVTEFVKNNPESIVKITFVAGESAIPNKDNELGKGKQIEPGILSGYRRDYLQQYINNYFNSLKQQGIIKPTVEIPQIDFRYEPPKTPWVGSFFCKQGEDERNTCYPRYSEGLKNKDPKFLDIKSKYDNEQKSELYIEVVRKEPKTTETTTGTTTTDLNCATGLKIQISVKTHQCQNAEFFVFANKTQLINVKGGNTANLNNAGNARGIPTTSGTKISAEYLNPGFGKLPNGDDTTSYGPGSPYKNGDIRGYRSDTFIVTEEQSQSIVKDGNGRIDIWMVATTTVAHRDIPMVKIEKDGVLVFNEKPQIVQGKLISLNACGDKVLETPTDAAIPDMTSSRMSHLKARMSLQGNINVSAQPTDEKAKVLERAEVLLEKMTELVGLINSPNWRRQSYMYPKYPGYNEKRAKIKEYYDLFQQLIVGDGKPSFKLKRNGKYEDGSMNSPMMGDVNLDLSLFYKAYNAIYYDTESKEFVPNGVKNPWSKLNSVTEWKGIT